jgi:cytochrome b subunit of formate dehydrogenase
MRNIKKIVSGEEKMDPPDTGFFNAGQKIQFWEIVGGCIVYPDYRHHPVGGSADLRKNGRRRQLRLHDISALIMLGGIFIHIYLSTIGEPGTFQAMIRGAVSEAWAWTFHPAWYKQVTGRDASKPAKKYTLIQIPYSPRPNITKFSLTCNGAAFALLLSGGGTDVSAECLPQAFLLTTNSGK